MGFWVEVCPECSYVAYNIEDDEMHVDREYLNTDEYRMCDGIPFKGELSIVFYRHYHLLLKEGDLRAAF